MKLSNVSKVVSLSEFRYGHDPAHYPIKGFYFVMSNPSLWRRVACVAFFGAFVAFLALVFLLVFALKPQAEAFGGGQWWSWLLAVLIVLLEAAIVTMLIVATAQSKCQTEVFCQTMKIKGYWREGEMKKQSICADLNLFKKAFFARIITFPLNIIPFFGAALFSAINATFIGYDYMDRYFDAIKMPSKMQRIEVFGEDRSDCRSLFSCSTYDSNNDYARFGFVVSMLEMIPLVGTVFFPLTNACAAALFACDIEAAGGPICMRLPEQEVVPAPEENPSMMNKAKKALNGSRNSATASKIGSAASSLSTAKKFYDASKQKGKMNKAKAFYEASKTSSTGASDAGANYVRNES